MPNMTFSSRTSPAWYPSRTSSSRPWTQDVSSVPREQHTAARSAVAAAGCSPARHAATCSPDTVVVPELVVSASQTPRTAGDQPTLSSPVRAQIHSLPGSMPQH